MVKVEDVQFVRYGVTNLERTEEFLRDFGLVTTRRDGTALYMRGTGRAPVVYVAELDQASGLRSIALRVRDDEAQRAQRLPGVSTAYRLDMPGGGMAVKAEMPGGLYLELVWNITEADPLPDRPSVPLNFGGDRARVNATQRPALEPARVRRLGHVALGVPDAQRCMEWLSAHLGMLVSDTLLVPNAGGVLGYFMRCDRGSQPADHHTFLIANLPEHGAHHVSFEVGDLDALHQGHTWLRKRGYLPQWGVGRHLLGSQIFDYWWDPDGNRVEHFTDGDLFDSSVAPGAPLEATNESLAIWGPEVPTSFFAVKNPDAPASMPVQKSR